MGIMCAGINIEYHQKKRRSLYLSETEIELPPKKVAVLYGNSGTGKTSLFNLLGGLKVPGNKNYSLKWNGERINSLREANKKRKNFLNLISSEFYFLKNLSAYDNIILPAVLTGESKKNIKSRFKLLEDLFHFSVGTDGRDSEISLFRLKNKKIGQLSNGQKEITSIARAFMTDTSYVLADEILRSFNQEQGREIWEKIFSPELGMKKKKGFFFITHLSYLMNSDYVDIRYTIENKKLVKARA